MEELCTSYSPPSTFKVVKMKIDDASFMYLGNKKCIQNFFWKRDSMADQIIDERIILN
jgi:hypothetical protein